MRSVIGWMAALFGSALLGGAVYQTVLSTPQPELDANATVETVDREPGPRPTLYRTEVRTVVEPTPTETVVEEVLIHDEDVQVSQPRTANPAPARTSAPKPRTTEAEDDDSSWDSKEADAAEDHTGKGDHESEDAEDAGDDSDDHSDDD